MRRGLLLAGALSLGLHAALFILPLPPRHQSLAPRELSFRLLTAPPRSPEPTKPKPDPPSAISARPATPAPTLPASLPLEPAPPTAREETARAAGTSNPPPQEPASEEGPIASSASGSSDSEFPESGGAASPLVPAGATEASGVSMGPPSGAPATDPVETLKDNLEAYIEANKTYPEAARRRGTEGVVRIALVIGPSGELRSLRRAASSGSSLLDKVAQDLLRAAFPLDLELPGELEIVLAIRYQLKR